jgi:hypothetical protein
MLPFAALHCTFFKGEKSLANIEQLQGNLVQGE